MATAPAMNAGYPVGMRAPVRFVVLPALSAVTLDCQPYFFRDEDLKVVGELQYGQTSEKVEYANQPRYMAFHFEGRACYKVDIQVDSINGQAMAALTDSRYKPIVSNFGSHVTSLMPLSQDPYPNRYFIVFEEERRNPATFTVTLRKVGSSEAAAKADYLSCNADSDCMAVAREACCHNGYKDAVNKDKVAAYCTANACQVTSPLCPHFMVEDTRVAQCNAASHQCEMVEPNTIRCGGDAAFWRMPVPAGL